MQIINPWDGQVLETMESEDAEAAARTVATAREAQPAWADRTFGERSKLLLAVRDRFMERAEELVAVLGRENGKPFVEAWFSEVIPNIDLFTYWAGKTERMLSPEKVRMSSTKYPGKKAEVRLLPKGVVAVISAWNYPVAITLRAVVPALMAGNTIVFKPSSDALLSGKIVSECFTEILPKGVFAPFYGPGALGSSIIEAGVDHLVFIGSVEVGRQVAALAGRCFTSFALELGGKDSAIVLPDADPGKAVEGIAWGAFTNCGQNCASIERLILVEPAADSLVQALVARVKRLRVGGSDPGNADMGPLRNQGQLDGVKGQLEDAVAKGAKVLCGGKPIGKGFGFEPTILDDVTSDMAVWQEETFGPLLPIRRVSHVDEAIRVANDCRYGLTNSLWTADLAAARQIARRLHCGVVTVNNHAMTASMPFVPWGGVKHTGVGSTNSRHALAEMVRPQLVMTDKPRGHDPWWYPYDELNLDLAKILPDFLLGRGGLFKVLKKIKQASRPR